MIPVLRGDMTTLRPLGVGDAEITLKWRLSPRAKFLQRGAQTVEAQRSWIRARGDAGDFNFIIEYRDRPVGMVSLVEINLQHRTVEPGRLLIGEQEVVGQAPVAFEAELLLYDYAFDELGMHKLYGLVIEDNVGMLKTRLYLGYKQDGVLRDHFIFDGEHRDAIAISLLEREYRACYRDRLLKLISLFSRYC